ncbi:MAG: EAL domain-containing protein [Spirochaetales bacterium]|nr:EAL domain-containing protein [Spirochaetales bacterium]
MEVTETTLIDNQETVSYQLNQIQAMGMKIKLDDFGTGYSSLSYLHHFPLDVLKIDRSFVSSLPQNITKRNIVGHIISLAHELGLSVIAEGIENRTEHRILGELGSDRVTDFPSRTVKGKRRGKNYEKNSNNPHHSGMSEPAPGGMRDEQALRREGSD